MYIASLKENIMIKLTYAEEAIKIGEMMQDLDAIYTHPDYKDKDEVLMFNRTMAVTRKPVETAPAKITSYTFTMASGARKDDPTELTDYWDNPDKISVVYLFIYDRIDGSRSIEWYQPQKNDELRTPLSILHVSTAVHQTRLTLKV